MRYYSKYQSIMNKESYTPYLATHPGELLRDELAARGMTQKHLAEASGIKASVVSETVNGKRPISVNVAKALEAVLDIPAEMWLNMQTQYELDTKNIERRNSRHEDVVLTIPVSDRGLLREVARKFGWACML